MCRIKRITALLLCLLICLVPGTLMTAASELIPDDEIVQDIANYETFTARVGDMTGTTSSTGFSFLSVDYNLIYKGDDVYYLEALVQANDVVEAGDPLIRIRSEIDTVALAEKELKIRRLAEELQRGRDERTKEITELSYKKWEGDAIQRKKTANRLDRLNVELERYVYEKERSISVLQDEAEEMKEKAAVEYIYSPYSGSVTNLEYFSENTMISNGTQLMEIRGESTLLARVPATFRYGEDIIFNATSVGMGSFQGKAIVSENAMPDANLKGTIIAIDVDEKTQKNIINRIMNTPGRDLSYAMRSVNIEGVGVDLKNVLVIPAGAKENDSGKSYVSVLGDDQMIHRRAITVGALTKDWIWVVQGLSEGDKVILK